MTDKSTLDLKDQYRTNFRAFSHTLKRDLLVILHLFEVQE